MFYIYLITNRADGNGKIYIGQTNNPKRRWYDHCRNAKLKTTDMVINRAFTSYGIENFTFEVIATCRTLDDVNYIETAIIAQENSCNPNIGYNVSPGGGVIEYTPEVRQKMSESRRKYLKTHDGPTKGMKHSEESKKHMSEAAIGKPGTNTGKKFSEEHKAKIGKSNAKERVDTRRFSSDIEKNIVELYVNDKKSMHLLGQLFNCAKTTIRDIILRSGAKIRPSHQSKASNGKNLFTIEQEKEICYKYVNDNVSRTSLAQQYGCGKTTIRGILIRHNVIKG